MVFKINLEKGEYQMNNKLLLLTIIVSLLCTLMPTGSAFAAEDTIAPEFHSVEIDKNVATGGDTINITVDASDEESDLESVEVIYQYSRTQDAQSFQLDFNESTKKYEGLMEVNGRSFNLNGVWKIAYILLTDKSGNKLQVYNEISYPMFHDTILLDLSHANLQIQGNDITPPDYHGLMVDKSEVAIGDLVKIKLIATDQGSGVDYATVRYLNKSNNANSKDILLEYNSATGFFEGTLVIENEIVGGRWIVDQLSIYDKNFNVIYLNNSEIQWSSGNTVNFDEADFTVIDEDAPVVTGVEDGGVYNTDVYPTFNEGTATLNNDSFESGSAVTEEGYYTLYVKDSVGNATFVSFDIDKTAPVVSGVEQDSVVIEAKPVFEYSVGTLNGEPFKSGTVISEEGHYTLVVTDRAGNETVVTFTVDRTGPIVAGVEDGRAYNSNVTPEFEGTATLNGEPFESGAVVTDEFIYELIVTDKAGNQTKVKFTIDKTGPAIYSHSLDGGSRGPLSEYENSDFQLVFSEGTAILDGEEITSGHIITEEGSYTLVATDVLGNETIIPFTLDKTTPVIEGVTSGYFNTDVAQFSTKTELF